MILGLDIASFGIGAGIIVLAWLIKDFIKGIKKKDRLSLEQIKSKCHEASESLHKAHKNISELYEVFKEVEQK